MSVKVSQDKVGGAAAEGDESAEPLLSLLV